MRLNAVPARTAALCAQRDTELAPHARDAPIAARRTFTAAQATLGQDGVSASNVRPALTQFARTPSVLRSLAGDLKHHPNWLAPGTAGDTGPDTRCARRATTAERHRAMQMGFYNDRTGEMPNFPRSSMLVPYDRARCLGQSLSPHVVAPPSRPQSCVARRAS
ncbi:hypothetical protein WI69_09255 [Burkholderia diffusa]|uniref:hypothetical protein n=1 Tax=Burkholderia diffusa TaxID=488732 RepID=UPI00075AE086|nr:hypothetical protein [Burkholderia diffusa]KVC19926.1 hypothetical protein WI69_09255 [Burkholderia diffusa]